MFVDSYCTSLLERERECTGNYWPSAGCWRAQKSGSRLSWNCGPLLFHFI